jgi:hypothetical protein
MHRSAIAASWRSPWWVPVGEMVDVPRADVVVVSVDVIVVQSCPERVKVEREQVESSTASR